MSENKAVAQRPRNDLASIIGSDSMKKQWALVLPRCLTPDRLARVALTQLRKTPKLAQCTQESFLGSMMKCAELGLEPNGRDAHLVPYGKECTFIAGYQGLVRLVRRDPEVKDVQVFTVRENDDFKWTPEGVEHSFGLGKSRGEVVGVYTKISWMNGTSSYGEPMTKGEAEAIMKRSKASSNGPWVTDFPEMWKKSVVRRDSKMWPLSTEIMDAVNADLETDGFEIGTSHHEDSPLDDLQPATEVHEQAEEDQEPPEESDTAKLIKSLEVIEKHRPEDFADACVMLNIPLKKWKDAPTKHMEDMLAMLNDQD